jgi:hypothetical protein
VPKVADILRGVCDLSVETLQHLTASIGVDISAYLPAAAFPDYSDEPARAARTARDPLPLHCKDVACAVNYDAVRSISSADPRCAENFEFWVGYATDPARYDCVPVETTVQRATRFSDAEVDKLIDMGHVAVIDPADVRGEVLVFTVDEVAKGRRRRISHTRSINEHTPRKDPEHPVRMARKTDVIQVVHAGDHMLALDFAGWFDQLSLCDEVSARMCFRVGERHLRLLNVPMGMRQSVGLACAVTERLLDFPRRSASVLTCIDNVLFVGARDAVLADAAEFRARCIAVGAILNEAEQELEELVVQRGEWCGVDLDLVAKTVRLTQKCVDRTRLSWALREQWTWRGLQSCVGLLFWSYGLIDVPVDQKFALLSFLSRVSADLQQRPELLDTPARIWPSALDDIDDWVRRIEANAPRVVPDRSADFEWVIATDASLHGWGYFALCPATGQTTSYGAAWNADARQQLGPLLGRSTFAEPRAVVNALCHWRCPARAHVKRVLVMSDNSATVAAFNRGFSTGSLVMNQQIARLRRSLPSLDIELRHIEGAVNPADGPSRGAPIISDYEHAEAAAALRLAMGSPTSSTRASTFFADI